MGFMDVFRQKTPQEVMRENKRMLDRSIRDLDRERMVIEGQMKKTMSEMKKMAKAGQEVTNFLPLAVLLIMRRLSWVGCGQVDGQGCHSHA